MAASDWWPSDASCVGLRLSIYSSASFFSFAPTSAVFLQLMETASPCDVFSFFFFSLFIWNARVTVSPIVYLAPLSHPFPGNPKHRKPASSIGPKGDSRQHRALGIPTKESHAQHRQHIQFLWFSSSSSFNTKKKIFFFERSMATTLIFLAKSWRWWSS